LSRLYQRRGAWFVDYSDERNERVRRKLEGVTTKRDAAAQLAELVAQVNRRRLGLEPAAVSVRSTVWELVEWWLTHRCPKASLERERWRLTKHVKGSDLGRSQVAHVRAADFERRFAELERPVDGPALSPSSINHLRAKLRTVFNRARAVDVFHGRNPLEDTKARRVSKRSYDTLSAEEVPLVLARVAPQWRGFFAAAVYLALRKGELAGLLKVAVDLDGRMLRVRNSYSRETTKGGHEDVLPVPAPLLPYLALAMRSPGPWLFPDERGRMRSPQCDPHLRLRTALKAAGLVVGYQLSCRKCIAAGVAKRPEVVAVRPPTASVCPVCKKQKLWVTPLPRPMRFHDLRHSTATILLRAGVSEHKVQRIMRHANIHTTTSTYAHLIVEDLRSELDRVMEPGTRSAPSTEAAPPPARESTGK
jgi:integrase